MLAKAAGLQKLDGIQKTTAATQSWRGNAICKKKKSDTFLW